MGSALRKSKSSSAQGGPQAQVSAASHTTLLDDINKECLVPINGQAAVLWEKDVDGVVVNVTFLLHHGRPIILYTVYNWSDYNWHTYDGYDYDGSEYDEFGSRLLAMTTAGDPVTDLPPAFTAISNPWRVCVSKDQAWAVVFDWNSTGTRSCTTLVRRGGDWRKHTTYSVQLGIIRAVTITPDGEVAIRTSGRLYKYDASGVRLWGVNVPGSRSYATTLCVGTDGFVYVTQPEKGTISCHGPDGSRSESIAINWPLAVCWRDAGLLVGHVRDDGVPIISVVSLDGRRRRQLAKVRGVQHSIAANEHFVVVGTDGGEDDCRLYLFDVSHVIEQ